MVFCFHFDHFSILATKFEKPAQPRSCCGQPQPVAQSAHGEGCNFSQSHLITVEGRPAARGIRIPCLLSCWEENPFHSINIDQSYFTTDLAPAPPARNKGGGGVRLLNPSWECSRVPAYFSSVQAKPLAYI